MKTKHAVIIFVFGLCFDFIGVLFKIMHYANADTLLIVGTIFKVVGGLLFLYKLLTHPKTKEFLNW
jgi:hypothetical protein